MVLVEEEVAVAPSVSLSSVKDPRLSEGTHNARRINQRTAGCKHGDAAVRLSRMANAETRCLYTFLMLINYNARHFTIETVFTRVLDPDIIIRV